MRRVSFEKTPKRIYITVEENALAGYKSIANRLTLEFCPNASDDLKIKPLLVYYSETPRAFNKYKIQKSRLKVMWRFNNETCCHITFLLIG